MAKSAQSEVEVGEFGFGFVDRRAHTTWASCARALQLSSPIELREVRAHTSTRAQRSSKKCANLQAQCNAELRTLKHHQQVSIAPSWLMLDPQPSALSPLARGAKLAACISRRSCLVSVVWQLVSQSSSLAANFWQLISRSFYLAAALASSSSCSSFSN